MSIFKRIIRAITVQILLYSLFFAMSALLLSAHADSTTSNRYNVVIVLDASGSMASTDPSQYRFEALKLFTSLLAETGNYLGGIVFSTGIDASSQIHEINSREDKDTVNSLLSSIPPTGGWTNIGQALTQAVDMLCDSGAANLPSVIVFLSDGNTEMPRESEVNASLLEKAEALQKARENDIAIYSVCLNANSAADTSEMEQLATATGGTFREVTQAQDLREVFNAFYDLIWGTSTITLLDDIFPQSGILETGFDVPGIGVEEVNIIIYGEVENIAVKRPDGSDYVVAVQEYDPFTMIKIIDLSPGEWSLITTGVPGDQIKINMVFNTNIDVELRISGGLFTFSADNPVHFLVTLSSQGIAGSSDDDYNGYEAYLQVMNAYEEVLHEVPMTVVNGRFEVSDSFEEGVYFFRARIEGNSVQKDSNLLGPFTVLLPAVKVNADPNRAMTIPENSPPVPVSETVEKNVYIWPFRSASLELDLNDLATDNEDEKLHYSILSSSFMEGKDYSVDDQNVVTVDHFSLRKGAFTIRATDTGGLSCDIEVVIRSYNIGLITAIAILTTGVIVLALIGFITYRSFFIPFMGSISVENIESRQRYTMQKNRGRLKLASLQVGSTGLGRDCYFQATGKDFIYFKSKRPVYSDIVFKPDKRIKIPSRQEVRISLDEEGISGIYVRFDSMLGSY